MILSNGTTLTPNKVDLLKEYQDVLSRINLNVPVVSSRERWAKRTNMKEHLYDKLIRNISMLWTSCLTWFRGGLLV